MSMGSTVRVLSNHRHADKVERIGHRRRVEEGFGCTKIWCEEAVWSDAVDVGAQKRHQRAGGRRWDQRRTQVDGTTISLGSVRTAGTTPAAAVEATVFAATAADVTDVFVDGRRTVTQGRHATIDVATELDVAIKELMDHD